jgi:hypothetical protein
VASWMRRKFANGKLSLVAAVQSGNTAAVQKGLAQCSICGAHQSVHCIILLTSGTGARRSMLDAAQPETRFTALHVACLTGFHEAVHLLIEAGASIESGTRCCLEVSVQIAQRVVQWTAMA